MSDRPRPPMPRGRLALWLALGGLFATFIGTLGTAIGFGMLMAALVIGIRAKREAKAGATDASGATAAIVIGAVSLAFMLIGLVGFAVFRDEIMAFEECSRGANTEVAREDCMNTLMDSLQSRINR